MKKTIKRVIRVTGRFLLAITAFIVLYLIAVFILSYIPVNTNAVKGDDVMVYVNSNGVHTDIIVPVKNEIKDWSTTILYSHTKANDSTAKYVAFGWGDKGFYLETPQWSDLKASTAFNAAFYLGTSAMHTSFYRQVNEDEECIKLQLSKEDYKALINYIEESFSYDAGNNVQLIANNGYGQYDAFYEGKGKYSLFYTCNTWTNCALKAANQRTSLWTPYDKAILYHCRP